MKIINIIKTFSLFIFLIVMSYWEFCKWMCFQSKKWENLKNQIKIPTTSYSDDFGLTHIWGKSINNNK